MRKKKIPQVKVEKTKKKKGLKLRKCFQANPSNMRNVSCSLQHCCCCCAAVVAAAAAPAGHTHLSVGLKATFPTSKRFRHA